MFPTLSPETNETSGDTGLREGGKSDNIKSFRTKETGQLNKHCQMFIK